MNDKIQCKADQNTMYCKESHLLCRCWGIHCSTGNLKGNMFFWRDLYFISKYSVSFFFFFLPVIWHKKHKNRYIIISEGWIGGFIMICASMIFATSGTVDTLTQHVNFWQWISFTILSNRHFFFFLNWILMHGWAFNPEGFYILFIPLSCQANILRDSPKGTQESGCLRQVTVLFALILV